MWTSTRLLSLLRRVLDEEKEEVDPNKKSRAELEEDTHRKVHGILLTPGTDRWISMSLYIFHFISQ